MDPVQVVIVVRHRHGLHAGPADQFVRKANEFQSVIDVSNLTRNSKAVNAKSILGILSIGVRSGDSIQISARGLDEEDAVEALSNLVQLNFGD